MSDALLDLYSDYLIVENRYATATGLSASLDQRISHDKITRFLSEREYDSKALWGLVKKKVREVEQEDGAIVFDDTLSEKPHSALGRIVNWHFDHSKGRCIKGINLLNMLYTAGEMSIPIGFEIVKKEIEKTDLDKPKTDENKNKQMRKLLGQAVNNQVVFKWVIADIWYGGAENMRFIKDTCKRDFIVPLKKNRKVALSEAAKNRGQYVPIGSLKLGPGGRLRVYLKGIGFPVTLIKDIFINGDDSEAIQYLVCSDLTATYQQIISLYQKRWKVEEYHRSLKNNSALSASPARNITTQSNHIFASMVAFFKLEMMKQKNNLNHYAMKSQIQWSALKAAFKKLAELKPDYQLSFDFA
jgi:hypothetical protein